MLCIARAEWADQSSLAAADMSDIYSGKQHNMHSGQQYQYSWYIYDIYSRQQYTDTFLFPILTTLMM